MPEYRYRPRENRTPVSHPVYGALVWDKLVRWPEPIFDPDFEEVKNAEAESKAAPAANAADAATDAAPKRDAEAATADGSK